MSQSVRSDEELGRLLSEHGIKHGPIVDSTRRLYEKKLEKAMEEAAVKPSSDKTFYREEVEEVTYITYHHPVKQEGHADMSSNMPRQRGRAEAVDGDGNEDGDSDNDSEPPVKRTHRAAAHRAAAHRAAPPSAPKKSRSVVGTTVKGLLLLAVFAVLLYYTLYRG